MTDRGRPSYQPTEKDRRIAEALAGWAIPQKRIARVIGVDPKTLRKHFGDELDVGAAKLEAQLAQNLLRIAHLQLHGHRMELMPPAQSFELACEPDCHARPSVIACP